ncbi:sugar phosphate isomerase/epimerase family protein [Streptomyces rugosispiralis]|uniref:Sugar phosphate isomerase/epimerase n=1 Tax=Streptomyces rugosispiralis TaxID=2967341 RepID=A0ABT1URV7_9ACTN|nr:sugar phosphate isomerase/epimerase [Streptomyces rugosispiralis]MCQ8187862.1 sugar phosphate isomerase/epimerase [Streptomyces rugosispiralis]
MSTPHLSVQLYSVREALENDQEGALARLAGLGLRDVEVFNFVHRAQELSEALGRHGLSARTGHANFLSPELAREHGATVHSLDETFAAAEQLGLELVIDPFVPAARWGDEQEIARTAALLNEAAGVAANHGLRVGYHNHSQEFVHTINGTNAFDLFVSRLNPDVCLEIDIYWAAAGGGDVVALLRRLGPRVQALHVKDGPIIDDPFSSGVPFDPARTGQVAPGQGEVPLDAALAAAPDAKFAIIEFDHYDGDIFEGIGAAVSYLNQKGIR